VCDFGSTTKMVFSLFELVYLKGAILKKKMTEGAKVGIEFSQFCFGLIKKKKYKVLDVVLSWS